MTTTQLKIDCARFFDVLKQQGIQFFTGVPDSLLKDICAYITDNAKQEEHLIVPNEGNAIGLAVGYHLATGDVPLVYMQNSGFGNCVNPLTSLADSEVYGIPMVLLIGWRGEPDVKDEPQHVKMGRVNPALLEALEIEYEVLPTDFEECEKVTARMIARAKETSSPVALLVKKNTFEKYALTSDAAPSYEMSREEAIKLVVDALPENTFVVGTTGKISREIYEHRKTKGDGHDKDFLTVGAMGHASHIALGLAMKSPEKNIICFDGDGAALMHMGGLASAGVYGTSNFKHIVFNNVAHESVGGQPTMADKISFTEIAEACGYKSVKHVETLSELQSATPDFFDAAGPVLLEVMVNKGSRDNLIRPQETPKQNKELLMGALT